MSTTQARHAVEEYVKNISEASPREALAIALAETERQKAMAAQAAEEYRAMAEVTFDDKGRIAGANMGGLYRLAQIYSQSEIVPKHYQRKPNDCFIACQMAFRLRVDPFAYMQNSYIVHGRPGLEAKMAVAMLNTSGKIKGRVRYREEADVKGVITKCTAFATDAETNEEVSAFVDWSIVVEEGWNKDKKSKDSDYVQKSKWNTMRDVMFHYRAASFLIKRHYPEVLMGMDFADEVQDAGPEITANATVNGSRRTHSTIEELSALVSQDNGQSSEAAQPESNGHQTANEKPLTEASEPKVTLEDIRLKIEACNGITEVIDVQSAAIENKAFSATDHAVIREMASKRKAAIREKSEAKEGAK